MQNEEIKEIKERQEEEEEKCGGKQRITTKVEALGIWVVVKT